MGASQPYPLTIVPEPDEEWIAAAQAAIRPIIMPWIRDKLEEWIAEGRLAVEERKDGSRWWKYNGAGGE